MKTNKGGITIILFVNEVPMFVIYLLQKRKGKQTTEFLMFFFVVVVEYQILKPNYVINSINATL